MRTLPDDRTRLQFLNDAQPGRPWSSCSEKRQCIMCERKFSGNEVIVRHLRRDHARLACPACGSAPQFWVRLGNPLLEDHVWADWECAITSYTSYNEDDLASAG